MLIASCTVKNKTVAIQSCGEAISYVKLGGPLLKQITPKGLTKLENIICFLITGIFNSKAFK